MRFLKIFTASLKSSAWALLLMCAGSGLFYYCMFVGKRPVLSIILALLTVLLTYSLMILLVMIGCSKEKSFMWELSAKSQNGGNIREVMADIEKHLDTMKINSSTKPFMNVYIIMLATLYQSFAEPRKAIRVLDRIDKKILYSADDPNFGVRHYYSMRIASCSYLGEISQLEYYYNEAMEYFGKKQKLSEAENNAINGYNINRAIANGSLDEAEALIAPMLESDNTGKKAAANVFMARCAAKRGDKEKVCGYFDKAISSDLGETDIEGLKRRKEYILSRMG